MTESCDNCGATVSDDYARVLGINGRVEACPHCPDLTISASAERGYRDDPLYQEGQA